MKRIALLGSTGSIGQSTLKVVNHLKERFQVVALAAKSNIDLLEKQALEFHPELIAVYDESQALKLKKRLPHIAIVAGMEGLLAVASHSRANFVVSALSGTIGLSPTLAAIEAGKEIGLANKEALVSGGSLVISLAKKKGVRILPIDSEHSAIFQCLDGEPQKSIRKLILTASGGPFRTYPEERLKQITVEQALQHPTWMMGAKVTIDCSTLINKGLEVIEAHWLFDLPFSQISVLIHPQSIIHSMVEFVDNSLLAQLGETSMLTPIQYALTYPERVPGLLKPFDLVKYGPLQFFEPDTHRFPGLRLVIDSAKEGGTAPCYLNAANEVLVDAFLEKRISWHQITERLDQLMNRYEKRDIHSLNDILETDLQAKREANSILN